jgi:FkbM family methyltransferase
MISFLKRRLITYYITNLTGSKTILSINYNFHAIMTSSNNRIKYIKNSGYEIKYGKKFRVFPTTECATYLYWNGVSHRGSSIGRGYFLDSIIFKDGDIVVDCGANLGDLKLYFDNIKVNIEYIAFEPNPYICNYLQKNIFPSKHHQIALWNEDTTKEFFVSTHSADSSLIKHPFTNQILKVEAKRLDELEFRKIRLFKVEAEGAEIEVLMGAEKILKNIDYISADLGPERGMDQKNTIPAVTNYLLSKNFELVEAIAPSNRRTFLFKNLASYMN